MTPRKHMEFGRPGKEPTSDTQSIMEGGGQAISPHRNFADGMKNLIIKDIKKPPNELDFQ